MKNTVGLYLLVLALLIPLVVGAETIKAESEMRLVFDNLDDNGAIAKKFRLVKSISSSASGQFSAKELEKLLDAIPEQRHNIWVIDLRQESHGFINGIPVTWYKSQNSGNIGKTADQIAHQEQALLRKISMQHTVEIYNLKKLGEGKFMGIDPQTITPRQVQTEQELVVGLKANYKRFYVLDHHRPSDEEVDNYVAFIKDKLQPEDWLHFHCRGGKGRSSMFMAMYDMVRNAHSISLSDIMQRQVDMGNIKLDSLPTNDDKTWKTDSSKQRYNFLQKFYDYVIDSDGYVTRSWSSWLERNS